MADKLPPSISFAGLVGIESASFTLSRGVQPSRGVVRTPVYNQVPEKISDFVAAYDGTTLTLADCAIGDCSLEASGAGIFLVVPFEDMRWKWQYTEIVGRYNVKRDENTLLYEKTPQELVELLFAAMAPGETLDATDLPNLTRPYVDWRNTRCDLALNEILTALDCDITIDLTTGEWVIVKLGSGADLPTGPYLTNPTVAIGTPHAVERIRVITADAQYQCLFELEPVGIESDGSVVPVALLTYTPTGGWADEDPNDFDGVTGTYTEDGITRNNRDLALESVDRWFRIVRVVHEGYDYIYDEGGADETAFDAGTAELNPPGFEDALFSGAPDIEKVEQLLPLLPYLNDTYLDSEYGERPRRMRLYGEWYDDTFESETDNVPPGTEWKDGFDVDLDKGIVKLPRPARFYVAPEDTDPETWEPARFYLYAVCQPDWVGRNRKVYYGGHRLRDGVTNPVTTLVEERLDIVPKYSAYYVPDMDDLPAVDSLDVDSEVYDQTEYYLDQMASRLVENTGATAEYVGLLLISPDGAIEQVQWEFGGYGTFTRASRFTRLNGFTRSYKEAKRDAEIEKAAEAAKRLAKADNNRGRTVVVRV